MNASHLHENQIYSEAAFNILLEYEIIRSIRYPAPISLVYIEVTTQTLDGEIPTSAFSIFETTLNLRLRLVDIPTRYGTGYLILLPATNETGARVLCKRIRGIFEKEFKMEEGKAVKFALRFGLASHTGGPTLMKETLIQAAEISLQQSY